MFSVGMICSAVMMVLAEAMAISGQVHRAPKIRLFPWMSAAVTLTRPTSG
jgi:hypothetical protein